MKATCVRGMISAIQSANPGLMVLWSGALLALPLQAADRFWDEIPLSPSTALPTVVLDDYWNGEFHRVNREVAAATDCRLVFFGDSITWHWSLGNGPGSAVWNERFAPYHPINMGNSGDITPVMLHRVTRGNLAFAAGHAPQVAVLLCGINNLGVTQSAGGKEHWDLGSNCPPQDIANGQRAIAQVFRRRLPHTRLIMMALLPVADSAKWEKCRRVNAIQAAITGNSDEVAFINLQDSFLQPDGTINRTLFTDGLHLSTAGYRVWADAISPQIDAWMKAPPLAPVKIMLLGGTLTEGPDSSRSYRRYLDGMLRRNGHLIDFVGSRDKHHNDTKEPDSYQFDPDHEGHWGKDSAWLAENSDRLLAQNVPDLAVIQLESGDIATSDGAAEGISRNLNRVIESLRAKNPLVRILIAQAAPGNGIEKGAASLNQKLLSSVRAKSSAQSPVATLGIDLAADPQAPFPGAGEAAKIGAVMAAAISPLLPAKQTSAPP